MAKFVLTDASVSLNSVDLSDHVVSVTLNLEAEGVDDTNMGDLTRINLGGLLSWSAEIEFSQDYAAGEVDATLFSLVGTSFTMVLKPTSSAVGPTNPSFTGTALLTAYQPLAGSVGEKSMATVSLASAGTLTRATA